MSFYKFASHIVVFTFGFAGFAALTGCGIGVDATAVDSGPSTVSLGTIQGSNFGGHAPITGAHLFVLEATSNGYGAIAKSLLSAAYKGSTFPTQLDTSGGVTNGMYYVQTDATGSFNLAGDYTCDANAPVYLYASGGVASTVSGTQPNAAIVNMAMLGVCTAGNFSSLNYVFMNEVSTVAMAYAMAGFANDSLHISSGANTTGLQIAALNAATLYNIQGGPQSTSSIGEGHIANILNPNNSNGTVPQATINTLADIVANCVDSSNTTVGTTPAALALENTNCKVLFLSTTSNGVTGSATTGGATIPIDTATAMINLAHYPAGVNTNPTGTAMDSTNPASLFGLLTGLVPFTPDLTKAPKDWTIALTYGSLPTPSAIAIDAKGDAYVGTYSATAGYITELSPQGSVNATSTVSVPNLSAMGLSTTVAPATAPSAVWATSNSGSQLYKFSGALASTGTFGLTYSVSPSALTVDSSGNVYVVDNSGGNYMYTYISEYNSAGTLLYHQLNYETGVANGLALAADSTVWLTATNSTYDLFPNPNTTNAVYAPIAFGGSPGNDAVAVDYQGGAWITSKNTGNQALVRATQNALPVSYGINSYFQYAIGGINNPVAVAVDGSNVNNGSTYNVWLANSGNNTVSEVNSSSQFSTLSASIGYQAGTGLVSTPSAIAVDNAGNVWVSNQGNSTVTEIIGSATPVTTPLAAQAPGVAP